MEAASYVPNTTVALKLARVLEVGVEDLFVLPETVPVPHLRTEEVFLLPAPEKAHSGQPVELCRIERRLIASAPSPMPWYFPVSDGILSGPPRRGAAQVQVFETEADFANRLLVGGCDPGISVLARHAQAAGIELVLAHRNSSQALRLLKDDCVHIAGTHLRDETSGESNLPAISRMFPKNQIAVVSFAVWEEGIVTARGNPKAIRGIEDFARPAVSIVNREAGAGSRKRSLAACSGRPCPLPASPPGVARSDRANAPAHQHQHAPGGRRRTASEPVLVVIAGSSDRT